MVIGKARSWRSNAWRCRSESGRKNKRVKKELGLESFIKKLNSYEN